MGYHFFLPMVLRWRASRAEAPLKRAAHKWSLGYLWVNTLEGTAKAPAVDILA